MRQENWQTDLHALIEARREEAFDFATRNCAFFAADGIEAVTGLDPLAAYRGKFKTERQAKALLKKLDGVATSQELLKKRLGGELQPIAFARIGDIVFADEASEDLGETADVALFGPIPGICYGAVSFFVGQHGLVTLPTLQMSSALWVS